MCFSTTLSAAVSLYCYHYVLLLFGLGAIWCAAPHMQYKAGTLRKHLIVSCMTRSNVERRPSIHGQLTV